MPGDGRDDGFREPQARGSHRTLVTFTGDGLVTCGTFAAGDGRQISAGAERLLASSFEKRHPHVGVIAYIGPRLRQTDHHLR